MKAVGIYDKEIFLVKIENGKPVNNFDVLRLVTKDQLESLRDPDDEDTRYNYKDLWKMAVAAGHYEGSLDDYIEEAFDEYDLDDDKEMWPGKDESGPENLTAEEREAADKFIEERYGIEVGTWECSGSYAPTHETYHNGEWYSDFRGFDFVFDGKLAKKVCDMLLK